MMTFRRVCHASLSFAVSFSFLLQPFVANAQSAIVADPAAAQRPGVGAASNGVPLIDLVAPNAAGVSHNKFTDFNVGVAGVVLNNSTADGVSQLGGVVLANPNMAGRGAASLILNEVTSANRSRLEGFTEIFGQKADYVLANPNGITCNGCGFINTPRATLTTGTPQFDANGGLASLAVRQGDVAITGSGLNASGIDALDIISRSVSVGGAINARSLNVVAGRNDVNYASRAATAVAGGGADAPLFAIDSAALGGMYANRIALVATERGIGVNMQGEMAANAGELNITADGRLALRVASATGAASLRSVNDAVALSGSVASGNAISVNAGTDAAIGGATLAAAGRVDVTAASMNAAGAQISAGSDLAVTVSGAANVQNAQVSAANGIAMQAGSLDLTGAKVVATAGSLTAEATNAVTADQAQIGAGRSLGVTGGSVSMANATVAAGQAGSDGGASIGATGAIAAHGASVSSRNATSISAGQGLDVSGATVRSVGDVTLSGASVNVAGGQALAGMAADGSLSQPGKLSVSTAGTLGYGDNGKLAAGGDVAIIAGTTSGGSQSKGIQAGRDLSVTAGTVANTTGGLQAGRNLTMVASTATVTGGAVTAAESLGVTVGSLDNRETMSAGKDATVAALASAANAAGAVISAGSDLQLTTPVLVNAGRISSQGTGTVTADLLANSGTISARDGLGLWVTSQLTNQGLAFAGQQLTIAIPGTLTNDGGTLMGLTGLVIGNGAGGAAAKVENISGTIQAGSGDGTAANLGISANEIVNRKRTFAVSSYTQAAPQENTSGVDCRGANEGCQNYVSYEIQAVTADSEAPKILADGSMRLSGGAITNNQGLIHANGDLTLRGTTLTNTAFDLITTRVVTKVMHWYEKHCGTWDCDDSRWTTSTVDRTVQSTGRVYGTIETSGVLDAQFSGTVANVGVTQGMALYGLVAGSPEDSVRGVAFDAPAVAVNGPSIALPPANTAGLYVQSKDPLAKALVETNPVLTSLAAYYGSDYFLHKAGIDSNGIARRLGDSAYETKLVRDAIFAETGKRYLSADVTSDSAQMLRLLDNAVAAQTDLKLTLGVSLSAAQVAALTRDIVWFEEVVVDGQTVLAPHLYLAKATAETIAPQGAAIIASAATVQAAQVVNSGLVSTAGALKVAATGDVTNQGGVLAAGTGLQVNADQDVVNLSGAMKGQAVAVTAGRDVVSSTAVTTVQDGGSSDGLMHQQASVSGASGVTITAGRDVAMAGTKVASAGDVAVTAGRDALLGAATVTDSYNFQFKYGSASGQTTRNLGSDVTAGGTLSVSAGRDVAFAGSSAAAGGNASVNAGGNVAVTSVQDSDSYQAEVSSESGGMFGGGKGGVAESKASTTTIGSAITAGNNVTVTANAGDIAVQASKIAAEAGSVALTASGSVAITAGTDSASFSRKDESAGTLRSRLDKVEDSTGTVVGSTVTAGKDVTVTAHSGDVTVQASKVQAGEQLALTAEAGQVQLLTGQDSAYHAETHNSSNAVWQTSEDKGRVDETTKYADLQAGKGIAITAAKGVVAEIHTGGASLQSTVAALAAKPETAWMAQVASRNDVAWRTVQEAHDSWDYKSQGLTGPAAAVIAIAVAIATQGAGAAFAGALAAEGTAGFAMAQAGFAALVSQASVSVINNRGDIGKVLQELGSAQTAKNLAIAVVSAGLTQGIADAAGVSGSPSADFSQRLAYQGIKTASGVAANTVIGGADLGDALKSGGLSLSTTMATQVLAQGIGDIAADLKIEDGDLRKIIAHAVAGCAAGQITQNCVAGAIGAGLQEAAGGVLKDISKDDAQKVQLAGLSAAVATLLVGGDASAVNTANAIAQDAATYNRQLHVKELQAIRDKAKALADSNGDGKLDAAEAATASEWEGRLTSEALRTVDAYWNNKLVADGEAARVLAGMAAANLDFNVTEGGRAVAFLQRDDFYLNRVLYAANIRDNADLYDKALANWTPSSRQALQGKVKPSSLALIESVAAGATGNATGDYVKRDANGQPLQGTIFDTLADVKAAERELITVERQLKEELAKPELSDSKRQETENQLKQIRYEMGVAATASDLVLTNYDRMVLDGKLEGLGTFAKDTAIGLLELNADLSMAKYSPEARARLQDRAAALLTTMAAPTEVIRDIQRTYEYADVLEQRGEITAAAALRTETDLALASTLSGVGGAARGAAVGIEKLAGTTGKLVAKAEALVTKGAEKTAGLLDPKSGQVSSGHGSASAAADAEAGMPNTQIVRQKVWNSASEIGPLGNPNDVKTVASTFRSGTYTETLLGEDKILYRVIPNGGVENGGYWTSIKPNGPIQSIIDSALNPQWGNNATNVVSALIPKGTTIYEGVAAPQGGLVGGGNQIYIPRVNMDWIVRP